jgi:hypothetical protein
VIKSLGTFAMIFVALTWLLSLTVPNLMLEAMKKAFGGGESTT